jgi:hypothetical protein
MAFSPDGRRLASGYFGDMLKVWDVATRKEVRTLRGHGDNLSGVAWSPDGKWLASAGADGTVRLWDGETGAAGKVFRMHSPSGHLGGLTFSPEGRHLLVTSGQGTVYVLRLRPPGGAPEAAAPAKLAADADRRAAEWVSLFNGKDLTGWEADNVPQGWAVKDGAIVTVPDQPNRGWLFTKQEFADFELRLEFALSSRANTGISVRGTPGEGGGNRLQLEVQIRDDASYPPKHVTGSIIPTGIDSIEPPKLKPPGEWNEMRLTARGSVLKVEVNGELAHEVDLAKVDPASLQGEKEWGPQNLKRRRGRIGLQYWRGEVQFRNLRVRELTIE